jgi:hypothetical protein
LKPGYLIKKPDSQNDPVGFKLFFRHIKQSLGFVICLIKGVDYPGEIQGVVQGNNVSAILIFIFIVKGERLGVA